MRIAGRRKLGCAGPRGFLIYVKRFRHMFFQLLDSGAVAGMSGKKFRRLAPSGGFHALPHMNGFSRVIAGLSSEEQADIIGLRLMFPTEWKYEPVIGKRTAG